MNIEDIVSKLLDFWSRRGCAVLQPLDLPVGAGTFHPATALRALGPEPWNAAYVQPSRRPTDGRYGRHPNRLQRYYQLQVVQKPSPDDLQQAYLESLAMLGIKATEHDVRFVEDDWQSPTLGAWGLGWEVWIDGMEVTQFTYFQEVGGVQCSPVMGEITYGVERLAMYLQERDDVYSLQWNDTLTYGELHLVDEREQSGYNFDGQDTQDLLERFDGELSKCDDLLDRDTPLVEPAYEHLLDCSHTFNLIDARGHYSVDARAGAIAHIRRRAGKVARAYLAQREKAGHPLLAGE